MMTFLRRLVYHKDPSIQVNALIVISLIIRHNEMTKEVSDCIGAPYITSKKPKVPLDLHGSGIDDLYGCSD